MAVKFGIVYNIVGCCKLVVCDGVDDDVCVPHHPFGKVGGSGSFVDGCHSQALAGYSGDVASGIVNAAPLGCR